MTRVNVEEMSDGQFVHLYLLSCCVALDQRATDDTNWPQISQTTHREIGRRQTGDKRLRRMAAADAATLGLLLAQFQTVQECRQARH